MKGIKKDTKINREDEQDVVRLCFPAVNQQTEEIRALFLLLVTEQREKVSVADLLSRRKHRDRPRKVV